MQAREGNWRNDAYTIDPEVVLVRAESAGELLDALTRLSHAYRSVVVLQDVEGWTVAEIAAALDIDLPAAEQRLRRGRMALVAALTGATTTLGSLRRDPDNVLDPDLARRIPRRPWRALPVREP